MQGEGRPRGKAGDVIMPKRGVVCKSVYIGGPIDVDIERSRLADTRVPYLKSDIETIAPILEGSGGD
jgi:hypothetical protein